MSFFRFVIRKYFSFRLKLGRKKYYAIKFMVAKYVFFARTRRF